MSFYFTSLKRLRKRVREGNGNPLQYSCLENPTDRGSWRVMVRGVAENWTWLKCLSTQREERICEEWRGTKKPLDESENSSVVSDSLQPLYSPRNSPGQNTGVGSCSLLQGIFPTQGSNPGLPHCRQILYQLSHQGSPRILQWVAYPFSSGPSWPWNWTRVSCIAGRFFTNWATREAQKKRG